MRHIFCFFVFLIYSDAYFQYTQGYKEIIVEEIKKFIFETKDELDLLKKTIIIQ